MSSGLKYFKIPLGLIAYSEHETNFLFTETIKKEFLISLAFCKAKGFEKYKFVHHCHVEQPFDMTIGVNCVPLNYEIKCDDRAEDTGNIFFEFYDPVNKKDSGYQVHTYSLIQKWLTLVGETLYEFEAQPLKQYLTLNTFNTRECWVKNPKTKETVLSSIGHTVPLAEIAKQWFSSEYPVSNVFDYNLLPDEYARLPK